MIIDLTKSFLFIRSKNRVFNLFIVGIFILESVNLVAFPVQADSEKGNIEFSLSKPKQESSSIDAEEQTAGLETDLVEQKKEYKEYKDEENIEADSQLVGMDDKSVNAQFEKESDRGLLSKMPSQLLQGQVTYTVPSGTPIKLKLAAVPSHAISLMDHDLNGNLYPARLGQKITAKTTEDIYVDHNKVIPEGTVFCGEVTKILPPRRVYRPGSLVLSFNQLITPGGRKFAFRAQADNFKKSTAKSKAKGFGIIAAHAAGGAIVGAIVAYDLFGMHSTIALHGYNIAVGAAGGALIATGYAIMRKGPKATLEPGDDLNMVIDNDLLMPVATDVDIRNKKQEIADLKIEIEKSRVISDGLGEHLVIIEANIVNESDQDLSSIDLFIEDTNGHRHPLCSSPEENSQFLFHIDAHSKRYVHLCFLTPYPKLKHQLVWLDHDTKIALAREKIQ